MQAALKKGAEVMDSLVKDVDEQLQAMVQNQEIALQSISDVRQKLNKQLDKLQKNITDEFIAFFKEEKRDMEATLRHCQHLMNGMRNTMKSTIKAVEENNHTETIVLYQRGQAEVKSCKTLVTEISKSFTSVSIGHQIVSGHDIISDDAMGKIVVRRKPRCIPGSHINLANPISERRVKEVVKFTIKSLSDRYNCHARGVVYLPCAHIVVSDYYNKKLKLFTDKGQYLDELTIWGSHWDMCLVDNNTVAVAVECRGGVHVVKVEASKLSLASKINISNGKTCYGITHIDGSFVVSTSADEVYNVTQEGTAEFLYKYDGICWSLTHDPMKIDTLVSVRNTYPGLVAVSRLSADKRRTNVMKVGVVSGAIGIDVDREGSIYVCGEETNNIVQMSADGTHVRELLTSSDGINSPWAISVCGDSFVVTNISSQDESKYIRVFQLY